MTNVPSASPAVIDPEAFADLVRRTRSTRRFRQSEPVGMDVLDALADAARLTASGGNLQPLRYVLVNDPGTCAQVFATLGFAAYLSDWRGPEEGERPAAYIVMVKNPEAGATPQTDAGIAAQTMLLAARTRGLGGCVFGAVNRKKLAAALNLGDAWDVMYVLALGVPAEEVRLEAVAADGEIRYWRDAQGVHHVPKRGLDEVVLARHVAK